jgi:hypothetical protein
VWAERVLSAYCGERRFSGCATTLRPAVGASWAGSVTESEVA